MQHNTFTQEAYTGEKLTRAVVRQVGGWESFKELASDVTNYGAAGGFSGFIYYSDTLAFYRRNKKAIVEYAERMADDLGEDVVSMVRGFNCLDATTSEVAATMYGGKHDTQVANALAWYALEEVARAYVDATEYA